MSTLVNEYLCAMERNQNGKYCVRVRASFGVPKRAAVRSRQRLIGSQPTGGWSLPVYFLASSFTAAMRKLEEALQLLQKNEERLRFWGIEHSDDPTLAGDLLQDSGLRIDRRHDFPNKIAELQIAREKALSASQLASLRRSLADSVTEERPVYERAALASD
jgi:hypothetical protein